MALTEPESDRFRDFAFAAADLHVSIDASGRILNAVGDAHLLHHPSVDRMIGKNAIELISEGDVARLRRDLWALGPGSRLIWEDVNPLEGDRLVVVRRGIEQPDTFSLAVSRAPGARRVRGDSATELLADRFRDIVINGRLMAAMQPVVDALSGAISHHEILARFSRDESPSGLIIAAEQSGQISHLDYIMVEAAASRLMQDPNPALRLAVNVSGMSIQHMSIANELRAVIDGHHFDRSRLILEITESAEINDIETAARVVSSFRESGVSVTLDDFGSGAASFNYLRALDVDGLKFDGSFLESSVHNKRTHALMRSVASMCAELGLSSVGERVETMSDLQVLRSTGVRFAQGYLFGAPEIDEEFFVRRTTATRNAA